MPKRESANKADEVARNAEYRAHRVHMEETTNCFVESKPSILLKVKLTILQTQEGKLLQELSLILEVIEAI